MDKTNYSEKKTRYSKLIWKLNTFIKQKLTKTFVCQEIYTTILYLLFEFFPINGACLQADDTFPTVTRCIRST